MYFVLCKTQTTHIYFWWKIEVDKMMKCSCGHEIIKAPEDEPNLFYCQGCGKKYVIIDAEFEELS